MKPFNLLFILLVIVLKNFTALGQNATISILDETYNQNQMIVQVYCFDCTTNDTLELYFSLENHDSTSTYFHSKTFTYTNSYNLGRDTLTFFHPTYMHDLKLNNGTHFKANQTWKFPYYLEDFHISHIGSPYMHNITYPNGHFFDSETNNWMFGGTYGPFVYFSIYKNMSSASFLQADYIGIDVDFMRLEPNGNCDSNAIRVKHSDSTWIFNPNGFDEEYVYSIPEDSILHIKKLINTTDFGYVYIGLSHICNTYFDNIRIYPVYNTYICEGDSLEINGVFQHEEGVYIDSLLTALGTDSIIGINLKHQTLITGDTLFATICEGDTYYLYDTLPVSNAGTFTFLTSTPQGCDSMFFLDLTIQQNTISTEITNSNNVLSYTDPQPAYTYQWIDLTTNQPISGETSHTFIPNVNGTYAVDVSDGICTQRSNSSLTTLGVNQLENDIAITPNPFSDQVHITFNELKPKVSIYITDIQSKLVLQNTYFNVTQILLNGNRLENGIYQITLDDGEHSTTKHIIRLD